MQTRHYIRQKNDGRNRVVVYGEKDVRRNEEQYGKDPETTDMGRFSAAPSAAFDFFDLEHPRGERPAPRVRNMDDPAGRGRALAAQDPAADPPAAAAGGADPRRGLVGLGVSAADVFS